MALKLAALLSAAVLVGGLAVAPAAHAQSNPPAGTPPQAPGASTDHGTMGGDGAPPAPATPPSHSPGMMGGAMMGGGMMGSPPNGQGQGQSQGMMGGGHGMMGGGQGMMGDRGGMGGMQGMMQMMSTMMQMNMMTSMTVMMNEMTRMAADCDRVMEHMAGTSGMQAKPPGQMPPG